VKWGNPPFKGNPYMDELLWPYIFLTKLRDIMGYLGITRRHHQGCATCNRYLYVHVCIYKFCITYYILCINIVMITTLQSKWIIRSFIKFGLACREELRWTCRGGHFPIEEGVKNKNILEPPWVQYPLFFKTPLNPPLQPSVFQRWCFYAQPTCFKRRSHPLYSSCCNHIKSFKPWICTPSFDLKIWKTSQTSSNHQIKLLPINNWNIQETFSRNQKDLFFSWMKATVMESAIDLRDQTQIFDFGLSSKP